MTLRQPHQDAVLPAADAARIRQVLAACSQLLSWAEANCGPRFAAAAQDIAGKFRLEARVEGISARYSAWGQGQAAEKQFGVVHAWAPR